ncbi:GAA [Symbiodinium pilosum]|uniref:glucan 1,4-alpha-glucosidase n=1 Tax=Symbiodinium pilosum TaxID=2952 RepID=A0A812XEN8_SYMPI|nr:GAA [Symbiodinium pilosum]
MVLSRMLSVAAVAGVALAGDTCDVEGSARQDCGVLGTTQSDCEAKGCCWRPADGAAWCFYPQGGPAPPPPPRSECKLAYKSDGQPFTDDEEAKVRSFFLANIDIQGSGAVVAAPDHNTGPGGDYHFHWERDGALSTHALLATADKLTDVDEHLQHYVQWVLKVQNQDDPHGIDVRAEPKYTIPDGKPFTGAWCRPQTDGPGLRAKTLSEYGLALLEAGKADFVKQNLWTGSDDKHGGAVKYDLEWLASNWQQSGCDLWEEIQSEDFFWGRYTMRASLEIGAQFAEKMGDKDAAGRYRGVKADIEKTLMGHFDGTFVFESQNRKKDSAVIEAFNVGDLNDGMFNVLGKEVLGTVITLNDLFCNAYEINQKDGAAGIPGILYGRYENDNYDGGNPWVLLSASLATLLYRQSAAALSVGSIDPATYSLLQKATHIEDGLSGKDLAEALLGAGDGVMLRIKHHVQATDLHMAEQIKRDDGSMSSAKDLTWNYANMLKAFKARKASAKAIAAVSKVMVV